MGLYICAAALLLWVILMVRNHLVHKHGAKAILIIDNKKDRGKYVHLVNNRYIELLLSPTKWTFKQMFPGLEPD